MSVLKIILVSLMCLSACNAETPTTNKPSVSQTVSKHTVSHNYCQGGQRLGERYLKVIWYSGNLDDQKVLIGRYVSDKSVSVIFIEEDGKLTGIKLSEKDPWKFTFNSQEDTIDGCIVPTTNDLIEKAERAIRAVENNEHETDRLYTRLKP